MRKFLFQLETVLLLAVISVLPAQSKEIAVIETNLGVIEIEFLDEKAPRHVDNFKLLAKKGFYDGTTFQQSNVGTAVNLHAIAAKSATELYAGGDRGLIYQTGASYTSILRKHSHSFLG